MTRATQRVGSYNEEQYVARMNLRFEKLLKQQIHRLEKEKEMRTKGLHAERKPYEEKLESFKARAKQVEQAATFQGHRIVRPGLVREKTVDRKLKDLRNNNRLRTGAGYSYIEQLFGNFSKPLISRPIRWGINEAVTGFRAAPRQPSLPSSTPSSVQFAAQLRRPRFARTRSKPHKPVLVPVDTEQKNSIQTPVNEQISKPAAELTRPTSPEEGASVASTVEDLSKNRKTGKLLPIAEADEPSDAITERPRDKAKIHENPGAFVAVPSGMPKKGQAKDVVKQGKRQERLGSEARNECFITLPRLSAYTPSQYTESLDLAQSPIKINDNTAATNKAPSFKYLLHRRRTSL